MRQLVYLSDATTDFTAVELKRLLDHARLSNRQDFVTGLLLMAGGQFLQALEGEPPAVESVFRRICADRRHRNLSILSDRTVSHREFGNWAMAANDGEEGSFARQVEAMVTEISCPSLKAKFNNFADYV